MLEQGYKDFVFDTYCAMMAPAKVPHEMHIYESAPHSFFDRGFAEWKEAGDDAWHRMLAFIKKNS